MLSHSVVEIGEQRRKREAMDSLINDIMKGDDDSVANSLRMALERGWRENIMDVLKEAKKRKELEISKITSRHYPEFKTSVREMLTLQPNASDLINKLSEVVGNFQSMKDEIQNVSLDLNVAQLKREKTSNLLEVSLICQAVAEKMVQARASIDSHAHYSAMQALDAIQHELPTLQKDGNNQNLRPLLHYLSIWLPMMTNKLLETIRIDSQESIQTVRLDNFIIGQTLLRRCAHQLTTDIIHDMDDKHHHLHLCTVTPSLSVLAIYSCSSLLRFDQWTDEGEFDSIVPGNFIDLPTDDGSYLVNQDLAPRLANIYKAVHIHHKLHQGNAYNDFYKASRETSLPHIFEEAEEIASYQSLASVMPNLIATIVGFFAIECSLSHGISSSSSQHPSSSTLSSSKSKRSSKRRNMKASSNNESNAFSEAELSILWDRSVGYLHAFISRHMKTISTPEQLLQVKEELLLLCELVSDELFALRPQGIYEIIRSLWTNFEVVQLASIKATVSYMLQHCAFQPFHVSTDHMFIRKIKAYRLDSITLDTQHTEVSGNNSAINKAAGQAKVNATLDALEVDIGLVKPSSSSTSSTTTSNNNTTSSGRGPFNGNGAFLSQTFPFSEVVPDILRELHAAIARFFIFATKNPHLGSRGEALCNVVKKVYDSMGVILKQQLLADGADTPLSKACQISIDATTFAQTSDLIFQILEPLLERFRWSESIDVHLPLAVNEIKTSLIKLSIQAQDLVFDLLSNKIADLLGSLVFINFIPNSLGFANLTHESIDEIMDFLNITFMWLTHLPQSARDAAHFTSLTKVASGIIEYLLSPAVVAVNLFCLTIFDNDVKKLIQFANNCGIPHLKQCFDELSELIKIVLSPELLHLVDNVQQRMKQYPKLDSNKLAILLEKLTPTPAGAAHMNLPRIDKAVMKTLAKKLRSQPATKPKSPS